MIVNYLIILTITFIIIIYKIITIVFNTTGFFQQSTEAIAFLVVALLIIHFFYCVYIFYTVGGLKGQDGPRGIKGIQGNSGAEGRCNASCGQKVCNALVLSHVNTHLTNKGHGKLLNKMLINKINKMCFADKYYGILISNNKNRPNEKKLIEYIEKTFISWIDEILKHKKGRSFLNSPRATVAYFKKYPTTDPFIEITKYDLWTWGEPYKIKPIVRIQCAKKEKLPGGTQPKIYVLETNNYTPAVFTTDTKPDVYGPPDCPYNQLGLNRNNERMVQKCFYYNDENEQISSKRVYKEQEYLNFHQPFSIYNTESVTTTNNQLFYPCGSVWRGTNQTQRTKHDKSNGPAKKTIIISGEMMAPTNFTLIWSSATSCADCMDDGRNVSFWRPIAPENYVSLGDIAVYGDEKPSVDIIKCVPKKYTREVQYEDKVWTEKGFKLRKYDSTGQNLSTNIMNKVSIWPIGFNNLDEERVNLNTKKPLKITGGYNLFRANNSHTKPTAKAYVLEGRYTQNLTPEPEIGKNTKLGFGWLGGKPREGKYSVYDYLGITTSAIITNTDTEYSPDGLGKSYYIENVKDNYYAIKCHDESTNSFNAYFTSGKDGLVKMKTLSRNNPNQLWFIDVVRDDKNEIKKVDDLILVTMKNKASGKYFVQTYDSHGVITEKEEANNSGSILKFQSFTGDIFD
jgi:hypothetical protein